MRHALRERRLPPLPIILFFLSILVPVQFSIGGVFLTGPRVIVLALFIPMTRKILSGELGPILPSDKLLFAFGVWNIFTLAINSPDEAISFGGSVAVESFGCYLLARTYIRTSEDFARTCLFLFWMIIAMLPFAAYESVTGIPIVLRMVDKLPFVIPISEFGADAGGERRFGLARAQVVFSHPIHFGVFCSTALGLAFVGFRSIVPIYKRAVYALASCLGVIFSVSSGAILPMSVQAGLIAWAWIFQSVKARWRILGILIAIAYVGISMVASHSPITVIISRLSFSPYTAYWRVMIFEWGMKNVWAHPFFGIGMNQWVRPAFMISGSMDNFWLLNTVRYGIPGFLLLAGSFAHIYLRAAFAKLDNDHVAWQFRRAWMITMTSLILSLATVHAWATMQAYVFFFLGTGVWFLLAKPESGALPAEEAGTARRAGPAYTRFEPVRRRRSD